MKTSILFAAFALSAATVGTALAQEASYEYPQTVSSQKTRAAVLAELKQARTEGTLVAGEAEPQRVTKVISTVTRAEVKAQTLAALASGELQALHSEYGSFQPDARRTPAATLMAGK